MVYQSPATTCFFNQKDIVAVDGWEILHQQKDGWNQKGINMD